MSMLVQRGGGCIRDQLFNLGAKLGVRGQGHAPAALPPGKKSKTHCIGGWVCLRAGLYG